MLVESCFQLGVITKAHGIQGNVILFMDTDFPERYDDLESVFVEIKRKLIPFFVESINVRGNKAIIKFEGINSIEDAESISGYKVYLPLELLPDLGQDRFYYHEVIGFTVFDEKEGELGPVKNIYEANGNDLFAVEYRKKEILIPIRDELIQKVNKNNHEIHLRLPEGLLEVFLNQ